MWRPLEVDFWAALARLNDCAAVPVETRQRAFAVWVGLFDLADSTGVIAIGGRDLMVALGMSSRVTWGVYRDLLIEVDLLRLDQPQRGRKPQVLRLLLPTD